MDFLFGNIDKLSTRRFCFDAIDMKVHGMLKEHFVAMPHTVAIGHEGWVRHFEEVTSARTRPQDFFGMAVQSFQWTRGHIREVLEEARHLSSTNSDDEADAEEVTSSSS